MIVGIITYEDHSNQLQLSNVSFKFYVGHVICFHLLCLPYMCFNGSFFFSFFSLCHFFLVTFNRLFRIYPIPESLNEIHFFRTKCLKQDENKLGYLSILLLSLHFSCSRFSYSLSSCFRAANWRYFLAGATAGPSMLLTGPKIQHTSLGLRMWD